MGAQNGDLELGKIEYHHFSTPYTHINQMLQKNKFSKKIARDYISTHTNTRPGDLYTIPVQSHGRINRRDYRDRFIIFNDQDQDSLLVKRRNDNHSPGPVIRELVPSSHQRSELSNTILCFFSRWDQRIGDGIPIPDSLGGGGRSYLYKHLYWQWESEMPESADFYNA